MHLDFTAEQHALRSELRAYYRDLFTPALRAALDAEWDDMGGSVFREVVGRMGRDGWLGIGWPREWGGQGRGPLEQLIFWEETYRARAPLPIIAVNTIGPTLMQHGTETQKRELLPGILRGELFFAVGYTEPGAGTDLASLQTRAVRDGDEWVVNGQKIYTTHAHDADYIWLAARTDPDAPRHKGITILLVPTSAPGFAVTPIRTLGGERTNATYYQDVRVPLANTVGPVNGGWSLVTAQLNHERVTLATPGTADALFEAVSDWAARAERPGGGRMLDEPWVQANLARIWARLEALKVLNWRSAWALEHGQPHPAEASAVKVLGTEFFVECYRLLLEVTGEAGLVPDGEPGALFGGMLERAYRAATTLTFGGGVNEVQREIIALTALGLPRQRRA
jgi:alkylation response protein AidB-like acyl-CoA dehydrogenase